VLKALRLAGPGLAVGDFTSFVLRIARLDVVFSSMGGSKHLQNVQLKTFCLLDCTANLLVGELCHAVC